MPMYTYTCKNPSCSACGEEIERFAHISRRNRQMCNQCRVILSREEIPVTQPPRVDAGHQTYAKLTDGSKIAGTFGKTTRKRGRSGLV